MAVKTRIREVLSRLARLLAGRTPAQPGFGVLVIGYDARRETDEIGRR